MPLIRTLSLPALIILLLMVTATGTSPTVRADQKDPQLGALFSRLQEPGISKSEAQGITDLIWQKWLESNNADVDKLMALGIHAMNNSALPEAVVLFTKVIELAPNFAEGWNKRATAYYLMREFQLSTADVDQTLKLEPRHFGALSGQGMIYMQMDNNRAAVKFFKRALVVNPTMRAVRKNIEFLEQEFEKDLI